MSEQNTIPAEMLDAAAKAVRATAGYEGNGGEIDDCDYYARLAEAALRAAGVPALRERIAELEAELGEANLIAEARSVVGMDLLAEADQQEARIAQLEAALAGRICEGCNALVANVGMLHLCGCGKQRNLCSACKAECACAGGE